MILFLIIKSCKTSENHSTENELMNIAYLACLKIPVAWASVLDTSPKTKSTCSGPLIFPALVMIRSDIYSKLRHHIKKLLVTSLCIQFDLDVLYKFDQTLMDQLHYCYRLIIQNLSSTHIHLYQKWILTPLERRFWRKAFDPGPFNPGYLALNFASSSFSRSVLVLKTQTDSTM